VGGCVSKEKSIVGEGEGDAHDGSVSSKMLDTLACVPNGNLVACTGCPGIPISSMTIPYSSLSSPPVVHRILHTRPCPPTFVRLLPLSIGKSIQPGSLQHIEETVTVVLVSKAYADSVDQAWGGRWHVRQTGGTIAQPPYLRYRIQMSHWHRYI
jgi:hypothetical protein